MDTKLAWVAQSVDTLYSLIDRDPFILKNIDVSPFIHTPLHEASAIGKTDMAVELVMVMPSFARKLNTRGYSPLHLAVENHHVEIALELVKFDPNLVRLRGRGGVTPLHLVVEKGDVDLLTEFLMASPMSIVDVNVSGETALHVAVLNGRYEELKVLTGWIQRMSQRDAASIETEVLNKKNREGNTVLHVAAYENKQEAVTPLLECLSLDRNIQNKDGLTSLDILRANVQYMDKETEKIIKRSGGKSKAALSKVKSSSEFLRSRVTFWEYWSTTTVRYRSAISDGTRNALLVITTLVMATTYQTALQPPSDKYVYGAHKAILWIVLWGCNTMAFWLSLSLTLIILPLGREYIWCYMLISVPLFCSYGLSMYFNTWAISFVIPVLLMIAFIFGFPCYLLFVFFKWKRSIQLNSLQPKSKMTLEGLATMV